VEKVKTKTSTQNKDPRPWCCSYHPYDSNKPIKVHMKKWEKKYQIISKFNDHRYGQSPAILSDIPWVSGNRNLANFRVCSPNPSMFDTRPSSGDKDIIGGCWGPS
jgi:hypothetical protein